MAKRYKNSKIKLLAQQLREIAPPSARIQVFFFPSKAASRKEVWSNTPEGNPLGLVDQRFVGLCKKHRRSILIFDATTEKTLQNAPLDNLKSCLCTPIFDDSQLLVGIFFYRHLTRRSSTQINAFLSSSSLNESLLDLGTFKTARALHSELKLHPPSRALSSSKSSYTVLAS